MPHWYEAQVIQIIEETPTVKRFFLKVIDVDSFDFLPGQFITLDLPVSEKRLHRWRSYSIASIPIDKPYIELCIVKMPGGLGTNYLFDQVTEGSHLKFKGPDGGFVLPKNIAQKDLVMICTGTGIVPFRSFLKYIVDHQLSYQKLHLIFGARFEHDILYRNELSTLAHTLPNFQYDIVLSQEAYWPQKGYVHEVYKAAYSGQTDNAIFYLCGWTKMIDQAVATLMIEMGCKKEQVVYELYG